MQGTADVAHHATHVPEPPRPQGQLSLPSGPTHVIKSRPRTDEDKAWYNDQLRIEHWPTNHGRTKLLDKALYERITFYASLNPEREAFPSVARLAREVFHSDRTVQRALRRLETAGLIQCIDRKGGHATSRYHPLCHSRGDTLAPEVISEEDQDLPEPVTACRKPLEPNFEGGGQPLGQQDSSEQQELRHKVSRPPDRPPDGKRVLRFWYGVQRHLGGLGEQYLQQQAQLFNRLPHPDKTRILNKLLLEERQAVASGSLEAFGSQQ